MFFVLGLHFLCGLSVRVKNITLSFYAVELKKTNFYVCKRFENCKYVFKIFFSFAKYVPFSNLLHT